MKNYSDKRQAIQRNYLSELEKKKSFYEGCCEGCGRNAPPLPSHVVNRSFATHLIAHPMNFYLTCKDCGDNLEQGKFWLLPNIAHRIIDWLQTHSDTTRKWFDIKFFKHEENLSILDTVGHQVAKVSMPEVIVDTKEAPTGMTEILTYFIEQYSLTLMSLQIPYKTSDQSDCAKAICESWKKNGITPEQVKEQLKWNLSRVLLYYE